MSVDRRPNFNTARNRRLGVIRLASDADMHKSADIAMAVFEFTTVDWASGRTAELTHFGHCSVKHWPLDAESDDIFRWLGKQGIE